MDADIPAPIGQFDPYKARVHTNSESDWFLKLAMLVAESAGKSFAKGQMRLRAAHQYFIMAHSALYADGAGDEQTAALLEALAESFGLKAKS